MTDHQPASAAPTVAARGKLRLIGAALMAPSLAMLIIAWQLDPRGAKGYGTAQQLDLPPCGMLVKTGYPCPSCGMTTSVSATAHGKLLTALEAQPFGVVLFAAAVALALLGATQALTGRNCLGKRGPRWWWLWAGLAGMFVGWGWVLTAGVISGKWPIH